MPTKAKNQFGLLHRKHSNHGNRNKEKNGLLWAQYRMPEKLNTNLGQAS
jgi:hypothetical protein